MLLPITKQIVQMYNTKIIRANYSRCDKASTQHCDYCIERAASFDWEEVAFSFLKIYTVYKSSLHK